MDRKTKPAELIHCIYTSVANEKYDHDEMVYLLDIIRTNNKKLNVTGMLLYDEGSFFQVLEGDKAVVNSLFDIIEKDPRHSKVSKVIEEPIVSRSFSEWTLGYSNVSANELKKIKGLNDFFTDNQCLNELDQGRALKLLNEFKNGKWRTQLS